MKFKETTSNLIKGIPKGHPLWSFFWKEWEYETNCETRSNLLRIEKVRFSFPQIVYQLFKADLGSTIFGEPKQSWVKGLSETALDQLYFSQSIGKNCYYHFLISL